MVREKVQQAIKMLKWKRVKKALGKLKKKNECLSRRGKKEHKGFFFLDQARKKKHTPKGAFGAEQLETMKQDEVQRMI